MHCKACRLAAVCLGLSGWAWNAQFAISQETGGSQGASPQLGAQNPPGGAAAPSLDLAHKVEELEKAVNDLKAQKATPPGPGQTFVLPWGKELKLTLGGFIQLNGEFGDVSSFEGRLKDGPNELKNRFRLRRARINVSGDMPYDFDFKLEGDFSQGDGLTSNRAGFSATDVFLNWHWLPEASLKGGQYKAPFGLEQVTPDTTLYTAERSLVTSALTPERQVGVQLWGKPLTRLDPDLKDLFYYALGIFNGNGRNTVVNDNPDFLYAGRGEIVPFASKVLDIDAKLKFGGNGFYAQDAAGTNLSQVGGLRLNTTDGSLTSFTGNRPDERFAWGVDASLNFGPIDLVAEYLEEHIRPTQNGANFVAIHPRGYYVQPSCFVWKKEWQLVAKWESFNPDQASHDDIRSITAGLNYFVLGDSLKFMLDYIHTWSDFRDNSSGTGPDEFDELLFRAQLMF